MGDAVVRLDGADGVDHAQWGLMESTASMQDIEGGDAGASAERGTELGNIWHGCRLMSGMKMNGWWWTAFT